MSESPFYAGTRVQFAWDSTSLGWYKTCPRLYEYSMIRGLRRKGAEENVHLAFGLVYHAALELYDRKRAEGVDHEAALRAALRYTLESTWTDGKPIDWNHPVKTRSTLIRSVVWYIEEFRDDDAKTMILANGRPAVELSFKMQIGENLLCGHLDRVVSYNDTLFVADRKTTTTTISSYYFDRYKPDNQMSLYTLATQVVFNAPVQGVIIDAAQIAVGFTRFARGITYRTPRELDEWLADTNNWIASAQRASESGVFPMNDKSCHQYGGCAFLKICNSDPAIRESKLASEYEVRQWNPLESR
jgi:hypothetical protein